MTAEKKNGPTVASQAETSHPFNCKHQVDGVTSTDATSVPVPLKFVSEHVPAALRKLDRWVMWRYVWKPKGKKWTKVPYSARSGLPTDATNLANGEPFDRALQRYQSTREGWHGVGFLLGDGIGGVDVDDCRNADTGELDARGQKLSARFADTYAEVSPSGTGFKVLVDIRDDAALAHVGIKKEGLELYGSKRYFAITGALLPGHAKVVKRGRDEFKALAEEQAGALRVAKPAEGDDGSRASGRFEYLTNYTIEQVREALRSISADCPEPRWFEVLQAIELQFGDAGLPLAIEWSATGGAQYAGEEDVREKYDHAKKQNNTLAERGAVPLTLATIIGRVPGPSGQPTKASGPRELVVVGADQIEPASVNWLWPGRLPRKFLTVFAADGGSGKTTATAAIAATLTSGAPWPNNDDLLANRRPPCWVLWLGIEDPLAEVTVPRLHAAGAVLSRVQFIEGTRRTGSDGMEMFSLQDDLDLLRAKLGAMRAAGQEVGLIVVDPVTSYLHGKRRINAHVATELRSVLQPFATLCDEEDLALICITHLTKDKSRGFVDSVMGSGALTQLSRNVWGFAQVPGEADNSYAMFYGKGNLGKPGTTIRYGLHGASITNADGEIIETSKVVWGGDDPTLTKDSLLGGSRGPAPFARQEIAAWLRVHLGDGAWHPAEAVRTAALAEGFSIGSLRRVTDELCERERWSGVWMWSLLGTKNNK